MSTQKTNATQERETGHKQSTVKPVVSPAVELTPAIDLKALQRAVTDPELAQPADILALQHVAGNRAVYRLIQTKLLVGPAGDCYEQEADRVAEQVMGMPTPAQTQPAVQRAPEEEEEVQMKPLAAAITPLVQRAVEEEDELQTKPIVQRAPEEEDELLAKSDIQRASFSAGFELGGDFEQQLAASRGGGSPLPVEVRSFMEPRFGADFSGVRLHIGSEAAQLNREVSAQAFTHGQDIYLGAGRNDLESAQGKQLLAHELTHTIQQGAAPRVRPEARSDQPPAAQVTSGLQREVIQRSEDEEQLTWENWKKASYIKYKSRKELEDIDAAVKTYGNIGPEDKYQAQRLLAVEKIYNLTDQFTRDRNINKLADDYRGAFQLMRAANEKFFELQDKRAIDFTNLEVREKRVREIAPSFYHVKDLLADDVLSKKDAANIIFREFMAYRGFTYTTATSNKTISTGLYKGSCEDFSRSLAELFNELGIDARTKTLDSRDFITKAATNFIDKNCPGNIRTRFKNYTSVNRFYFKSHDITTTDIGDFDPTAGVLGDAAVDPNLAGFGEVTSEIDKKRYGLKGNEKGWSKGNVLLKEAPVEKAPTGGMTYVMKTI